MKNKRINLNKIEKLAGLTFRNSIRLHNDSILLFKEKSYASAYFLSILALEEYGKMCILTNILFHSRAKETTEKEEIEEHLKLIYSHRNKQSEFIYVNMLNLPKNFIKNVCNGKIEILKQNSVYVGLLKKKNKINLKSKIQHPFNITEKKAKHQITIMNDCLLELIFGVIKEAYIIDSNEVEALINMPLYIKIKNNWTALGKKTQLKLDKLKNIN